MKMSRLSLGMPEMELDYYESSQQKMRLMNNLQLQNSDLDPRQKWWNQC